MQKEYCYTIFYTINKVEYMFEMCQDTELIDSELFIPILIDFAYEDMSKKGIKGTIEFIKVNDKTGRIISSFNIHKYITRQ